MASEGKIPDRAARISRCSLLSPAMCHGQNMDCLAIEVDGHPPIYRVQYSQYNGFPIWLEKCNGFSFRQDTVDPNLVWNLLFDELTVDRELRVLGHPSFKERQNVWPWLVSRCPCYVPFCFRFMLALFGQQPCCLFMIIANPFLLTLVSPWSRGGMGGWSSDRRSY